MGITKIESGSAGGRFTFVEKPEIDPLRVIQLIQTRPDVYKMDAQQRLRFNQDLGDPVLRIKVIEELLDTLGQKAAA